MTNDILFYDQRWKNNPTAKETYLIPIVIFINNIDILFPYGTMYKRSSDVNPPHSRLFIIGSKSLTEKDYWDAFKEFGDIEEVWVVKDRNSGDNKGY